MGKGAVNKRVTTTTATAILKLLTRRLALLFSSLSSLSSSLSSHSHLTFPALSLSLHSYPRNSPHPQSSIDLSLDLSCTPTSSLTRKTSPLKSLFLSHLPSCYLTVRKRFEKRRSKDSQPGL